MDFSTILSAISTVGFPIVCCCVLFYQNSQLQEKHETEISELKEVINNNTLVLKEISTKLNINEDE